MELFLDSANYEEIKQSFTIPFLTGLTTTPTFMHKEGIENLDDMIIKLSNIVPVLQIEALGRKENSIISEAKRLIDLGLNKETTVFKIPVSLEGSKACYKLIKDGFKVNMHLIYTVQQAYLSMAAGATYVCPLVGRLQDQGQDALGLISECVQIADKYQYDSKVMFSSVRNLEHVRNALSLGVDACTVPYKILMNLPQNHFTEIGTKEFFEHSRFVNLKVKDVIRNHAATISSERKIIDALVIMTESKLGAVTILDSEKNIHAIFTDGDLRRMLEENGSDVLNYTLSQLSKKIPFTIDAESTLLEASKKFHQHEVDTLIVLKDEEVIGMIDIQDLF